MKRSRTLLVLMLAISFIFTSVIIVPQNVRGEWGSLYLVPSQYTGTNTTYTPGETMDIVLRAGDGEQYSLLIVIDIVEDREEIIRSSVTITGGEAKVSYLINEVTPDGNYKIRVKYVNGTIVDEADFTVQGYAFLIETDRDAYLDGDTMKIFWTANNLKDQTLPPVGVAFVRVWNGVWNDTTLQYDETTLLYNETLTTSAGSLSYILPSIITDYDEHYWVDGWFKDNRHPSERHQYSRADFRMKGIGVLVDLDKEQYSVGSLLTIEVKTVVTDNQSYPSILDTAEPGCDVSIKIYKLPDEVNPIYVSDILQTDTHGIVKEIVALDDTNNYTDGSDYVVRVRAVKGFRDRWEETGFRISESSSLSVVLDFDKAQYTSGDTLFITASALSIGGGSAFTFLIEIRDADENGTLFFRTTQSSGDFTFDIPDDFVEGWFWIRVTADDGEGNSASLVQTMEVVYAIVLVNVDRETYIAEDILTISYGVVSEKMSTPTTFYMVEDSEGNKVDEGVAAEGSFTFTVPTAPSNSYVFTVIALGDGKLVQGYDAAVLFSSYVLIIDFNKNSYGPGDTMVIEYEVFALGDATLPDTFVIYYGLANGPQTTLQTSAPSGSLTYIIPEDIDEGDQLFTASCDFGGDVNEVVTVKKGANPLWYLRIGDIPVFSIILFFLLLISLYSTYRLRKRLAEFKRQGFLAVEKARRPIALEGASMATVECVECGNPIEITTSRRPIEVMCPHCGEIQHIEK